MHNNQGEWQSPDETVLRTSEEIESHFNQLLQGVHAEKRADDLLSTKRLAGLLYSMGRTFDGLQSSFMATEEFLRTGNPEVVNSRADLALLLDLKDASAFVLHYDYAGKPFDLDFLCEINAHLTRTAAMQPGFIRSSDDVQVRTKLGVYKPGVPDERKLVEVMGKAAGSQGSLLDAAKLFINVAKMQPFGDGNKRTALLAANGLRVSRRAGSELSVPTEDPDRSTFNDLLSQWYVNGDAQVAQWLADWNDTQTGEE